MLRKKQKKKHCFLPLPPPSLPFFQECKTRLYCMVNFVTGLPQRRAPIFPILVLQTFDLKRDRSLTNPTNFEAMNSLNPFTKFHKREAVL